MADDFLQQLEQDNRERFSRETFEVDTSGFSQDFTETWRIQPLPAMARDKLISCLQNGEYYKGLATALVWRAYKTEGSGRRFRPSDIDALMKNHAFLDWIAEEINFRGDFDWLVDLGGDEEKKHSTPIRGDTPSS